MSKSRLNLHEYQQYILERLQHVSEAQEVNSAWLGVYAGGQRYLVSLHEISEVLLVPEILPVPLTQDWFLGMANVRGNLYAITDMAQFFGIRQQPPALTADSRILLAHDDFDLNAGFLVDGLAGLRNLGELKPLGLVADVPDYVTARYEDQQHNQWEALDMARLLGKKEFLQVAA